MNNHLNKLINTWVYRKEEAEKHETITWLNQQIEYMLWAFATVTILIVYLFEWEKNLSLDSFWSIQNNDTGTKWEHAHLLNNGYVVNGGTRCPYNEML